MEESEEGWQIVGGRAASSKYRPTTKEVRRDTNRFEDLRQSEEAEEVSRLADQAKEVQDQDNWDAERRLNFFSGGKNQDEMERRSLRLAQEHSMGVSRGQGHRRQQQGRGSSSTERPKARQKRSISGWSALETRGLDRAAGPSPSD
eukprot:14120041-Heterocapsa_arctica.AAC.1